jgi:hypothetical protein
MIGGDHKISNPVIEINRIHGLKFYSSRTRVPDGKQVTEEEIG